jgi:hypothetical protein
MFEGQRKHKLELESLRDQFKRFFDNEFYRTFPLFPPILRKPYLGHKVKEEKDDEEEEKKHMPINLFDS